MDAWRWRVYGLGGLTAAGLYFLATMAEVRASAYVLLGFAAFAALVFRSCRSYGAERRPWLLLAASQGLWMIGDAAYFIYHGTIGHAPPVPSPVDLVYLGGYPLLALGLFLLLRSANIRRPISDLIDAAMIATGGGIAIWTFIVVPLLEDPSRSTAQRLAVIAFPIMDIMLFGIATRMAIGARPHGHTAWLLALAIGALLVGDMRHTSTQLAGVYHQDGWADLAWIVSYISLGLAALHTTARAIAQSPVSSQALGPRRLAVLTLAALTSPAALLIQTLRGQPVDRSMLIVGGSLLFLLALLRIGRLVRTLEGAIQDQVNARLALQTSSTRFHTLIQNSSDLVAIIDSSGAVRYLSPSAERLLGYRISELIDAREFGPPHPSDQARVAEFFALVRDSPGDAQTLEFRIQHKNGTWPWFEVVATNLLNEPAVAGIVINARDVTERKAAEAKRQASEERFRSLVQHASDIISVINHDGTILYASPAYSQGFGVAPDELLNENAFSFLHPDDVDHAMTRLAEVLEQPGKTVHVELRGLHRDGGVRTFDILATNMVDTPSVGGVVINARDITERVQAEARIQAAEIQYRTLVEQIPAVTYTTAGDGSGLIDYLSPQIEQLLGFPQECWHNGLEFWRSRIHLNDQAWVIAELDRINANGEPCRLEHRMVRRDGQIIWVRNESVVMQDADGQPLFRQGVILDITEQRRLDEERRRHEQEFRALVEHAPDIIARWNQEHRLLYINPAIERALEVNRDDFIGNDLGELPIPPAIREQWRQHLSRALETAQNVSFEWSYPLPGHTRYFQSRLVPEVSPAGVVESVLSISRDFTEEHELTQQLAYQAFHDPLTRLPNRALVQDRLEQALARGYRQEAQIAVLLLDLDNFKLINDTYGHTVGDRVLIAFAATLRECLRASETAGRLGGDEFVLVLEGITAASETIAVAERILAALERPITVEGMELPVRASIGISLSGLPYESAQELLRSADIALYHAKANGRGCYKMFDHAAYRRFEVERDLVHALEHRQFQIVYQPIVHLESGQVHCLEALIRWQHPSQGLVSPDEFIPIAEEIGLVIPIGHWVLETACLQVASWHRAYPDHPRIGLNVNLSPRQFRHLTLLSDIEAVLHRTGLDPAGLKLEITEGTMMENPHEAIEQLRRLRALGVQIAIDDFGTGYSSLAYLKQLPVDILKIDRIFIEDIEHNAEDQALVQAIVAASQAKGIRVVAEGVETARQQSILRQIGCDYAQGYHFAPAWPPEMAETILFVEQPAIEKPQMRTAMPLGAD